MNTNININRKHSHTQRKLRQQWTQNLFLVFLVIGIIIIVNLFMKHLNYSIDMTETKVFSLSQQSEQVLSSLDEEIKLILLHKSGANESTITRILKEYDKASDRVSVTYVDPELHPNIVQKYQEGDSILSHGSIIVEKGDKYKIISATDMYTYDQNYQKIESVQAESKITNSILYVANEYDSIVYTLAGHNESLLPGSLEKTLENENYKVQNLQLLQDGWDPDDNDVVIINGPKKDLTDGELESLLEFLEQDGKVILFVDLTDKDFPNFNILLNTFGVDVNNAMVFENDKSYTVTTQNFYLLPEVTNHTITNPLLATKSSVISVYAQPIETLKVKKDTLEIQTLLMTSNDSYAKTVEVMKNSSSQGKTDGDLSGPFNIAVAISNIIDKEKSKTKGEIVLFSSSYILKEELIEASNNGNLDIVMNSLNWLTDRQDSISIRAKDVSSQILTMNQSQQLMISILVIGIIPLLLVAIGLFVWYRRKNN